ncbi:high affinity cAMP-specific 3',5'-cyclic phosphodiesterase 7A-like isoform X1 [Alosa sapidissima]|uniref:high affinity cAMP-specific 3',5'-cyclic phosphodiesterase 7A-like isoform X1 n=1 Tax=Alosa sapidissima TaxID=34773 RepID=UPI001C0A18B2|nr:high affinity cAMP-specific 3',5'-cyclic phosphodiesterase 7A-like isoform X1 [Alosa sapidissima]
MEVYYQLPVLALDRPVPKHVLGRRGAISLNSNASLFGGRSPRQLSKRRGAISYDRTDQTALFICLLDMRLTGRGIIIKSEKRGGTKLWVDFRLLHNQSGVGCVSGKRHRQHLSLQRYLHPIRGFSNSSALPTGPVAPPPPPQRTLGLLDQQYYGQASVMLKRVASWNFDIFLFDRLTDGETLGCVLQHLFHKYGLIELFGLDPLRFHKFAGLLQEYYYTRNPYHTSVHAADVTQAMCCFLQEPKLAQSLTSWDILLALLGAATHDLSHPGVTQDFLIKSNHYLALLYQDGAVLENHHWKLGVCILRESGLLSHLPVEDRLCFEGRLNSLILATDISKQREFLSRFDAHLKNDDLSMNNGNDRHFILQMALKCADICNPCRPAVISKQWSHMVTQEFFQQGDMERALRQEISPLCDRHSNDMASIQTDFISFVAEPLFTQWAKFCKSPLSRCMLGNLQENKRYWSGSAP